MITMAPSPELVLSYIPRGASRDVFGLRNPELVISGPAGCIAGETRIYNPVTGEQTPVKELYEKGIAPIVQTLMGAIQAETPFKKGVADLYRVTLASGRNCLVTGNHLLLTPDGWKFARDCSPGTPLLVGNELADSRSDDSTLGFHVARTAKTNQVRECVGFDMFLSTECFERNNVMNVNTFMSGYHAAGLTCSTISNSRRFLRNFPRSASVLSTPASPIGMISTGGLVMSEPLETASIATEPRNANLIRENQGVFTALFASKINCRSESTPAHSPFIISTSELSDTGIRASCACVMRFGREVSPTDHAYCCRRTHSYSCHDDIISRYHSDGNKQNYWDTVSSIEYERTDEYFDLHVPVAEHYLAEGIWHHNTGKSRVILEKLHLMALKYPCARILMLRKTRRSLTESGMVTYWQKVRPDLDRVQWKPSMQQYQYPNGSILAVGGMDRPSKIMSSEWDVIYAQECTELSEEEWEACTIRLRNGKMPYQQLLGDCNPDAPTHWLRQRAISGKVMMIESRHEDNPLLFDESGVVTPEGARYLGTLDALSGVRLARYRYGVWAAAEGTVYEGCYDRAKNVIKRFPIPDSWPRYMSLDFGYTHPFVAKWYAEDEDGRYYCYREIYMTKRLVEEHARQVKALSRWGEKGGDPLPRAIYADHDAEGREVFSKYTGLYTTPAHKAVSEGIQAMAARLRPAGDGKPRLMYFEDCLVERDMELVNKKHPTCTVEEFDSYVWDMRQGLKKGDQPVKEYDHGMDSCRYLCAKDIQADGVSYMKNPWS